MEPRTAAASVGFGILLLAWLASAVSEPRPRIERRTAPVAESAQLDRLRADLEIQGARLRTRLAAAPIPKAPNRNPFTFGRRDVPLPPATTAAATAAAQPELPDPVPTEPELVLIGIAERSAGEVMVRTAILAGAGDELHLVVEGEEVAGYRVRAISIDVVELERLGTGTVRRIHLR
jgi:hypothetical protein